MQITFIIYRFFHVDSLLWIIINTTEWIICTFLWCTNRRKFSLTRSRLTISILLHFYSCIASYCCRFNYQNIDDYWWLGSPNSYVSIDRNTQYCCICQWNHSVLFLWKPKVNYTYAISNWGNNHPLHKSWIRDHNYSQNWIKFIMNITNTCRFRYNAINVSQTLCY